MALAFGLGGVRLTYEVFVALTLNAEWARAAAVTDAAAAAAIAAGAAVPDEWIELLCDDPAERALWKAREIGKALRW